MILKNKIITDSTSLQHNNKYLQYEINENSIQDLIKEDFKDLYNDFKKDEKDSNLSRQNLNI